MELDALEDGELSCDSDSYTPLERPASYAGAFAPEADAIKPQSESDARASTSSASDSDSDGKAAPKLAKIKTRRIVKRALRRTPGKYEVWSRRAQEDSLLETLNNCDVTAKNRSRTVESYDNPRHFVNKRTHTQRKDMDLRFKTRQRDSSSEGHVKGAPKILLDVVMKPESSNHEIGVQIANNLLEAKEDLIVKVACTIGREKTLTLYNEVKRIEADGGMLIMNQTRRRTPGGVFLFLLKHDDELTAEQRNVIFEDERKLSREEEKLKKKQKSIAIRLQRDKLNILPDITKADFEQKLHSKAWSLRTKGDRTDNEDVVNPPPTPEAESGNADEVAEGRQRDEKSYDADYLDLSHSAASVMDLF